MTVAIAGSVGQGGRNSLHDVRSVQQLLNKWIEPPIMVTGACSGAADDRTVRAIRDFQSDFLSSPDGRVDPGGTTIRKLNLEWTQLPQKFGQLTGYYQYGRSADIGKRQWGTKDTVDALQLVAFKFQCHQMGIIIEQGVTAVPYAFPPALVGIGDISFKFGGYMSPHSTHRDGIHIDIRPIRQDKAQMPIRYTDTENYDQTMTKLLVELLLAHSNVKSILFNDPEIKKLNNVGYCPNHDDHLHVTMKN